MCSLFIFAGVVATSFSGLNKLKELILLKNKFTSFPDIYALKTSLEILNIGKWIIGVCTDNYVFYQSVLEKKTDWSGVSQRT